MIFALMAPSSAFAFPGWIGNCCGHPNRVTTGTIYAGDLVTFEIMMNDDYFGLGARVGVNEGAGDTEYEMSYGGNDSANSWWQYQRRFAAGSKSFYFYGWETYSGSTIYDSNGGANYSVTITAINNPSSQSATVASSSSISLGWAKNAQSHDVMIVRKTSVQSWTEPTQGQSYSVGNSIGNGVVVYKGNATSATASDLSPSTAYDFKFYSVNYDYYSAGVTDSATTDAAASPTITLASGSSAFGNVTVNKTSSELSYTWSGTTLSGAVTVTAPSGFEISKTSGSGFASSLTFTPSSGTIAENTVYVRFKPTAVSSYSGNITHAGGGATSKTRAVSGTGTAPVDPASFSVSGGDRQNTLTFSLGTDSKPVVIVYDTDNTFSAPSGAPASVGQAFAGGTVVYNGSTSPQTHSGLNAGVQYYYKAFSYDSTGNFYSSGLTDDATTTAPQYGLRDDGGVNLPTLTYWYTGAGESDLTEKGSEFSGKNLGNITALYLKDATIKTFKNGAGDVTGTTFLYKLWEDGDSEPASYTERSVGFSSNDGDGNQTWSDFGAEIDLFSGLGENYGDYNLKILFTVSGSGVYGDTNSGPFTATFTYPLSAPSSQASSLGVNNERQTQMGVAWTSGNGSRRIVVARAGSAVNFTPADGTDYTHNTSFSAAADAGSGNKVVYDGTESSFTLTGLSADTTYHLKVFEYNGTGANTKYLTASAPTASGKTLGNPTSINVSRDGIYPATTVDISWTENNSKNVMVALSTETSPSGTPTAGVNYDAGQGFGDWTVVARSDDDGALEVTGLVPGQAYLFKLWSENNGHYSSGSTPAGVTTDVPQGRNYQDSATPYVSVGTVYVGDNVVVGAKTYGDVAASSGSAAGWYAVIKADNGNLASGASEGATGGSGSSEDKTATTPRFSSAGTWYWGMRVDYGATYGDWYYLSDQDDWADLDADGNTSTLSLEVSALVDPTISSATPDSDTQIDLAWTPNAQGHFVMIVRSTDASFTAPTADTEYNADDVIGGDTVIYRGAGSSFSDTGLSAESTYHYKFYSENWGYYSAGVTTNASTTATPGTISVAGGAIDFADTLVTQTSAESSYEVTGANLTGNITVTAPEHFKVATSSGGSFGSEITLGTGGGTVYVRFEPTTHGEKSGNITHASTGASTQNKAVSGTAIRLPESKNPGTANATTAFLGDTVTLNLDAWQTWESNNRSYATLFSRWGNADLSSGETQTSNDNPGSAVDAFSITTPRFTQTGTFYWAMRVSYGEGNDFFHNASRASFTPMDLAITDSASLAITVSALQSPSGFTASSPSSTSVQLDWTSWEDRNVLLVRRAGSAVSWTPTPGQAYEDGATPTAGHTVVRGSLDADTFTDSGLTAGTTYHYALFSENWNYYSTATVASVTTGLSDQTITFGALGDKTYGDEPFMVSATSDSGLTVSFSSLDTDVVTVDGTTVTIVGAGEATIRASQAGNGSYNAAANVDRTFTVDPKAVTGNFVANNKPWDGTTAASVGLRSLTGVLEGDTVGLTGGTATFADANVGNGKTVTLSGASLFGADSANYTLTSVNTTTANITKANQTITFSGGAWQTKTSTDDPFTLTATASSGLTVSFASSDTGVATISGSTVTIVGEGTTTITASQSGDGNYNAASPVQLDLTVSDAEPETAPTKPSDPTVGVSGGELSVTATADGATNYLFEVATDPDFNNVVYSTNSSNSSVNFAGIDESQRAYYTRVTASNAQGASEPSTPQAAVTVTIPGGSTKTLAVPVTMDNADRALDGALGTALASALSNGDQVLVWNKASQTYNTATLTGGSWNSNLTIGQGEAFFVKRVAETDATISFSGSIGNTGEKSVEVTSGYSLISLSEGRPLNIQTAFDDTTGGTPASSILPTQADYLYVQDEEGNWRGFRYTGSGWRDLRTGQNNVSFELAPGDAYYYRRATDPMDVNF
jgi:hypothetical protein